MAIVPLTDEITEFFSNFDIKYVAEHLTPPQKSLYTCVFREEEEA